MKEKRENQLRLLKAQPGQMIGVGAYLIGLFNATMELIEQGYYFAVLIFGLYSAVSLQKAVRDKDEGIPVTNIYYGISRLALIIAILLMASVYIMQEVLF